MKQKDLVVPVFIAGVVLLLTGLTILANKLMGGQLNGVMRHLGWLLIPLLCVTGVGCIMQALEWRE